MTAAAPSRPWRAIAGTDRTEVLPTLEEAR